MRRHRHRGPLNLWPQLTQLNRVSQLTQLTRLTQLTEWTQLTSTGSRDLAWPPGQVDHCDYNASTGSIGVNWVRRFSVPSWSIRPPRLLLLLLGVNWVKWVHWVNWVKWIQWVTWVIWINWGQPGQLGSAGPTATTRLLSELNPERSPINLNMGFLVWSVASMC